jgi:hypothetical protein
MKIGFQTNTKNRISNIVRTERALNDTLKGKLGFGGFFSGFAFFFSIDQKLINNI